MQDAYNNLEDVVRDPMFAEVDLFLRGGGHIDENDVEMYAFLRDAEPFLEEFYDGYDCELVYSTDRFYWLRPRGDALGRRHLKARDMVVGQALTLLLLDPATVADAGKVRMRQVLELLQSLLGREALAEALLRGQSSSDEAVLDRRIREEVAKAVRELGRLGFCDVESGDSGGDADSLQIRLRSTLMRFADPVRGRENMQQALRKLVAEGSVAVGETA